MTRRLRVVIVAPGFSTERDEPGLAAVVDLVERLAVRHEVDVVAMRHPGRRPAYRLAGATVHALGVRRKGAGGRAAVLAAGVTAVVQLHRRHRVDLVHGLWLDEPGAVAAIAGRLIGRPSIASLMGGELTALPDIGYGAALGRGGRWTSAVSLRLATVVTAASAVGVARLAERHRRVVTMPLGVDVATFRREGSVVAGPDDPTRILFVGSLEPVKDPATLIRAFARLAPGRPSLALEVVGDGQLRAGLERLAADAGVADRVAFLGSLPRGALPDRYRAAAVLVVSSRHEAQSMVAVEAAACGLPVVGTDVGIVGELGMGARVVPGRDPAAMAEALARVLDDPAEAVAMGRAGRAVAEARFDIDHTEPATERLYEALTGPSDTPSGSGHVPRG